jgi:Lon protease-like protein
MELPLFPLHSVLCPGVALPLHIFEERYRLMVARCIEEGQPFGVVLIREGHETRPLRGRVADVGTTALIRQAGRYPDGRLDIVTVGGQRFRIESLDEDREPYLVGEVSFLEEPIGDAPVARRLAERVSERFLRYLELLQPALESESDSEIEVELVVEAPEGEPEEPPVPAAEEEAAPAESVLESLVASDPEEEAGAEVGSSGDDGPATDSERAEMLMAAARRLVTPEDPTHLSYVLSGLIQVELPSRQELLEAPDTESRLRRLDAVLRREIQLLERRLKPLVVDPRLSALRRN